MDIGMKKKELKKVNGRWRSPSVSELQNVIENLMMMIRTNISAH